MSQAQVDATVLLCRLLERDKPEYNGQALFDAGAEAATHLLRERLLVVGHPLDWVNCPECCSEIARVVRDLSADRIVLFCPECEDVDAPRRLRETYKAVSARAVAAVLSGLGMNAGGMKVIEPERVWRLGTTEPTRGKPLTWYFARQLGRPEVGARLREQIQLERTASSCVVLTTSELPLPIGSPLAGFDVRTLRTVARIGQSRFEFFTDRQAAPGGSRWGGRAAVNGADHPALRAFAGQSLHRRNGMPSGAAPAGHAACPDQRSGSRDGQRRAQGRLRLAGAAVLPEQRVRPQPGRLQDFHPIPA